MATDIERLVVQLEARTKEYERALAKAQNTTVTQLRKIEGSMAASASRQQTIFARMGTGIQQTIQRSIIAPLAALAGVAGARAIADLADSFTGMENALKVTGLQGDQLAGMMERLFQIATKHGAPVESLTELYRRLALVQKEMGISSQDLISFTDNVAAALRVSGVSATEARGSLLQLAQMLDGTAVRAQEFNSILDGAPAIMQAAARGLEEAGGSVAKLRQLMLDQKLSSQAFFAAFQAGAVQTQQQAASTERTIGQAWENIRTAFIEAVGEIDNTTGASDALTASMGELARQVGLAVDDFNELKDAASGVVGFFQGIDDALRQFGRDAGIAAVEIPVDELEADLANVRQVLARHQEHLARAIAEGNERLEYEVRLNIEAAEAEIRRLVAQINELDPGPAFERVGREGAEALKRGLASAPISLDDYLVAGDSKEVEKQQAAIDKLIASLQTELAVLQELDPVTARMLSLRETMVGATDEQARAAHNLVGAIEAERGAKEGANMERELQQRIALVGATDAQTAAVDAMQRAADAGASRSQIKRIGELAAAHVNAAKAVEEHRRRQEELQREHERARDAVKGLIENLREQVAIEKESDPIKKELIRLSDQMASATAVEREEIEKLVRAKHAEVEANRAITASQPDRHAAAANAAAATGPGQFGGSLGSSASVSMDFSGAGRAEMDALNAEANILQTGLQYKQLSAEETKASELRLAEIAIETAKLQQRIVEYREEVEFGIQQYKQFVENTPARYRSGNWNPQQELELMLGFVGGFAGGGEVRGPGGPKSDTVPIMASAGEFVVNAASTKKHRALLDAINGGSIVGMADGGIVGRLNGTAQRLANGGMVAPAAGPSRGDISLNLGGVHVTAQDGRVSRESTRDAGRQVASQVAYHLREMGVI